MNQRQVNRNAREALMQRLNEVILNRQYGFSFFFRSYWVFYRKILTNFRQIQQLDYSADRAPWIITVSNPEIVTRSFYPCEEDERSEFRKLLNYWHNMFFQNPSFFVAMDDEMFGVHLLARRDNLNLVECGLEGFVEFVDPSWLEQDGILFGYNSLFQWTDGDGSKSTTLLYGPLSVINDANWKDNNAGLSRNSFGDLTNILPCGRKLQFIIQSVAVVTVLDADEELTMLTWEFSVKKRNPSDAAEGSSQEDVNRYTQVNIPAADSSQVDELEFGRPVSLPDCAVFLERSTVMVEGVYLTARGNGEQIHKYMKNEQLFINYNV